MPCAGIVPLRLYLLIVGLADNVLKPTVMGRGLSTPVPVIFIGLLGGTLAHGIVGLFVGPILLAVAWELMMAWIRGDQASLGHLMQSTAEKKSPRKVSAQARCRQQRLAHSRSSANSKLV